jgi:hypothetical protein
MTEEKIYDSAPLQPDDNFWLEQGKKMIEGSLDAIWEAAKAMITGLELMLAVYLGILGFSNFIPEKMPLPQKSLFIVPLLVWLIALYFSLEVMMTKRREINPYAPEEIAQKADEILQEKQHQLQIAFWLLAAGLVLAMLLFALRLKM